MEIADKTEERLEMVAVKAGNHTHMADDIDCVVSQMDCLCQWQWLNYRLMILNYLQGVVACQMGRLDESYLLSSVGIQWSRCSVNNDGCKLLSMREVIWNRSECG